MANAGGGWRAGLIALFVVVMVLSIPAFGPGYDYWVAWKDVSYGVNGAVAARRGGALYVVVSGEAQRTTEEGRERRTHITHFPRLTSYRASDGQEVARRQYSPVVRFSYVDTVVHALTTTADRVWTMSTERAVALHAVDPATLADVVTAAELARRVPAMAAGIHIERGATDSPVSVIGRELFFRVDSGEWLALDPSAITARVLPPENQEVDEAHRAGAPRGNRAVEQAVRALPGYLEPAVLTVSDAAGAPDPAVSYVVTQTSLDRDRSRMKITRWDTSGPTPVAGWSRTIDEVPTQCCHRHVWRDGGAAIVWYERWLLSLDDATGATRWVRRL